MLTRTLRREWADYIGTLRANQQSRFLGFAALYSLMEWQRCQHQGKRQSQQEQGGNKPPLVATMPPDKPTHRPDRAKPRRLSNARADYLHERTNTAPGGNVASNSPSLSKPDY